MEHKRTGLILFGILWILVGLFLELMAVFVVVSIVAAPPTSGGPPARMMIPAVLMYAVAGAAFVALGIGSIMARRWARSLILAFSWMWLVVGVLTAASMFFVLPKMFGTLPPEQAAAKPFIIGCAATMVFLFFILLPGLAILFYRGPKVKAAVEAFDPVPRWTDQPMPLLVFVIWMLAGAACLFIFAFMYSSFPLGPWMLRGASVYALMFVMVAWMLFIGLGALKRKPAAWWAAIGMLAVGITFAVLFATRTDLLAWYREMGLATDPKQAELMLSIYKGPYFIGWMAIFWSGYLAYLIYLRRYFFVKTAI